MIKDLSAGVQGEHASNLGALIVSKFSKQYSKPGFIVDPVVVDELQEVARLSGHPELPRKSIFHALNHKAIARKVAEQLQSPYHTLNLIIAHMGGGISVASHHKGRVIDVNNALDGEGPYSPERSGTLPVGDFARLCFSGKYDTEHLYRMIKGKGGMVAYLGTTNMKEIENAIQAGNNNAKSAIEGMAYQISKDISSQGAVLYGKINAIVLTGGLAFYERLVNLIKERCSFIAPIYIFSGEKEMESLAMGALRILTNQEKAKHYTNEILNDSFL
jgi:butyrate kinase